MTALARHHFRVEMTGEAYDRTGWKYQAEAYEPVPATMHIEAWYVFDANLIVYEGHHEGTPADLVIIDKLVRAAASIGDEPQ